MELGNVDWKDIGVGDEASCYLGIVGLLRVVKRVNHSNTGGEGVYIKHRAARVLDDYFLQQGLYTVNHIPSSLGFFENGYYYEHVKGSEGFPWEFCGEPCELEERSIFNTLFLGAGFGVNHDVVDTDGNIGKNIILGSWNVSDVPLLPKYWMRIDFGSRSCPFNPEKFRKFIETNRNNLEGVLKDDFSHLISFLNSLRG